jgi:hypothetical protein
MAELSWGWEKIGGLVDKWPKCENGEPEAPVFLESVTGSQFEIDMQKNMLDAFGIPVVEQYPLDGQFGKVILGMSGTGVDFYVPESMLEDAQKLISGEFELDEEPEAE